MVSVFVVTSGFYSDHGVEGVFSNNEKAQTFIHLMGDTLDEPKVKEWELDRFEEHIRAGKKPWDVMIDRNGNTDRVIRIGRWVLDEEDMERPIIHPSWRSIQPGGFSYSTYLHLKVWATDEEHAIKVANEHRIRLIAEGTWPEDF